MTDLETMGMNAVKAGGKLSVLSTDRKNTILRAAADRLEADTDSIIKANAEDMKAAEGKLSEGLMDRLKLDESRIRGMAEGIRSTAELQDPVGVILDEWDVPSGIHIKKVSVPMGVVGIIYEARPNVTADAFAIAYKSGNAVILKGGSDAVRSCKAVSDSIRNAIRDAGEDPDVLQFIDDTDRAVTNEFMHLDRYVDVMIPRGSAGLIAAVKNGCSIPVIETGSGNCHIFVDETADIGKAIPVIVNAKTQRTGVCNAVESLVVHEKIAPAFLPELWKALSAHNVEVRADSPAREIVPEFAKASPEDFSTEYLALILSVKTVSSVDEAIEHINRCHTGHSDAILTADPDNADRFLKMVDSACVYVNASTRFTDGGEFGFGAEIGISTQKLHARGPMGLKELTSYKYLVSGDYTVRS
ncbi:MAG: glutamate-5-semialdehyde dehydrogenase [Lachnospiraceae bacterium]|nr:glutamate-5-semialdehyde dehydrogenase [Lachnospiraceae bacterium]